MSSPATSTSTQEHTKHVHIQYVVQETNTQPFNGPLSWTTQVSQYQKGKPIWVLLKQETVSGSGISWAICKSASCSRQTTTPAPHRQPLKFFTGRMPFLPPNIKALCIVDKLKMTSAKTCQHSADYQMLAWVLKSRSVNTDQTEYDT